MSEAMRRADFAQKQGILIRKVCVSDITLIMYAY